MELSSQQGVVASLIQFKCTKYFCDDLTFDLEDAQGFNSISESSSEIRKASFILIYRARKLGKTRYQSPLTR